MSNKSVGMIEGNGLNPKQRAFVREYLVDYNGTQAAIRAGYSSRTAAEQSSDLLRKPNIKELIVEKEQQAAAAANVSAEMVIGELATLCAADPRELVSVHRGSCRFCHSVNHDRAWSHGEYLDAYYQAQAVDPNAPAPPLRGGIGYDFTREPNPECLECHGFGEERVIVKDTRKLSRAAAKLIAGVKKTKDGLEIRSRDQDGALLALAKITGVYAPERQEHSGPGGGPIGLQPINALTNAQLEAILKRHGKPLPKLIEGNTNNE